MYKKYINILLVYYVVRIRAIYCSDNVVIYNLNGMTSNMYTS